MSGYIPSLAQVDELHRRISPSQVAYDLIHTHCLVIATITRQLVRRQNALFIRRCTLPDNAPELTGKYDVAAVENEVAASGNNESTNDGADSDVSSRGNGAGVRVTPATLAKRRKDASAVLAGMSASVPPTDGVKGGMVPSRLLDEDFAVVGAMLHDIGTYLVLKHDGSNGEKLQFDGPHYILHGLRGYDWLISQGVDESVAQFARNHTGVGLTRDQVVAQHLPLPPADYVPVNLEQEVVMVADKYNSKSIPPRFLTAEAYARKARRFGSSNERQWLDLVRKYGVPDIPELAKKFGMKLDE